MQIFHAGTEEVDGKCITTGGRVLNVTAKAEKLRNKKLLIVHGTAGKLVHATTVLVNAKR